jgi:rhomboid protease GluP
MAGRAATIVFVAVLVVVYFVEVASGGSTNADVLVRLGANVPELVVAGQVWRWFTSIFLHIGMVHILLNSWALFQLGGLLEAFAGPRRMLTVALASGLAGSAASTGWHLWNGTPGLSAGASGAVFGLLGGLVGFLLRHRQALLPAGKQLLSSLLVWAALNVYLGLSQPGIDNAAHFGGAATGALLGYVVLAGRARTV